MKNTKADPRAVPRKGIINAVNIGLIIGDLLISKIPYSCAGFLTLYSEKTSDRLFVHPVVISEVCLKAFLFRTDLQRKKEDFNGE